MSSKHSTTSKKNSDERHVAAVQAEVDRYRAMTPIGLRRIYASFPELEDLIESCAWLVSVADPVAGRSVSPTGRGSSNGDRVLEAGQRVAWFKGHQEFVRGRLRAINQDLADKIEVSEHDRYREEAPRCWYRDCRDEHGRPTRNRRQPIDATECQWCGRPFSPGQGTPPSGARETAQPLDD